MQSCSYHCCDLTCTLHVWMYLQLLVALVLRQLFGSVVRTPLDAYAQREVREPHSSEQQPGPFPAYIRQVGAVVQGSAAVQIGTLYGYSK